MTLLSPSPEPPPAAPVALSATWNYPVLGAVNVKVSLPLVDAYHTPLSHYAIRLNHQDREIDQVQSVGTALRIWPGIPSPAPGGDRVTYDGLDPDLKGTNGVALEPFDLEIVT